MDEREAQRLEIEIQNEGWNTEIGHNSWSGRWTVRVWKGDTEEDQEEAYSIHFPVEFYRLHAALAEGPSMEDGEYRYPVIEKDDLPY